LELSRLLKLGAYSVVFSGGGALGAWEVGCLRALLAHHDGAYPNAVGLASGLTCRQLHAQWHHLTPERVFTPRPRERSWPGLLVSALARMFPARDPIQAIARTAATITSCCDNAPLQRTLRDLLFPRWDIFLSFEGSIAIAVTDLKSGANVYYFRRPTADSPGPKWTPITSFEVLEGALLASSAIPILFPPVGQQVDGGVLRNQPLSAADTLSPPGQPIYVLIPQPDRIPQALSLASLPGQLLQTWMSSGFGYELAQLRIRNLAAQGLIRAGRTGVALRPVCVIRATCDLESLGSGLLAFGRCVPQLVRRGWKDARAALREFEPANGSTWTPEVRL
jgi:predicted acylesterase/phospholipase RssA